MADHARTFFFASRFLPPVEKTATIALYAFFRTLDDLVDEVDVLPIGVNPEAELAAWRAWVASGMLAKCPRPEIGRSFAGVIHDYQIPHSVITDFLDGMESDLRQEIPGSVADLEHYSYQVAATAGLAMAHVFGATTPKAIESARRLGVAMQLTNILRDIGGDLRRGRVYLPDVELGAQGLAPGDVAKMWRVGSGPDPRLKRVIARLIERADDHYAAGIDGIALLPENVQVPMMIATRLYQRILRQLERNDYDSLRTRVSTTRLQKVREAFRCMTGVGAVATSEPPFILGKRVHCPVERN